MIYGDDYDTKDGTCVRDYIHVTDLATAHIKVGSDTLLTEFNFKALEYLVRENTSNHFNLGSGLGYTVKEVIDAARRVTGHSIPTAVQPR